MPISRFDLQPVLDSLNNGALVLVPTLRIQDALLAEYHNIQTNKVYRTPLVLPVDVWIREIWDLLGSAGIQPFCDLQILSGHEESLLWQQIIDTYSVNSPLLNPEETANLAAQSYQDAMQWGIWKELENNKSVYTANPDVSTFIGWSLEFQGVCQKLKVISLADTAKTLAKQLLEQSLPFLPNTLLLSQFDSPPPLYQDLFAALGQSTEVKSIQTSNLPNGATRCRYEFPEREQEIQASAAWAKKLCIEHPDAHIGIIIPQTVADKGEIERRFEDTFNKNATLSFSARETLFNVGSEERKLSDFAFVQTALCYLALFWSEQDSHQVCDLLRSPFVLQATEELQARLAIERKMRQQLSPTCALFELTFMLNNNDGDSHTPELSSAIMRGKTLVRESRALAAPRKWCKLFEQLLETINWPGDVLTDSERQALKAFKEVLDDFAKLEKTLGQLSADSALAKFRQLTNRSMLRRGFSARKQLSLFTMSESLGQRFDYIWLLGLDDQSWPAAASPSPFLPYDLQKQRNLPGSHGDIQFTIAQDSLRLTFESVKTAVVVSHYLNQGDQHLRPCSLTKNIPLSEMTMPQSWPLNNYSKYKLGSSSLQLINDVPPPPLHHQDRIRGGVSVLSNQSSCPFRAFAKNRLNTQPLDDFTTGLSPIARGISLHIALEHAYRNLHDSSQLNALSDEELSSRINFASSKALNYLESTFKKLMTPKFSQIEEQRIQQLLARFIDIDKRRPSFQFLEQEKSYQWHQGNLSLTLKVDRIDKLDDQSLALVDYKTGKHVVSRDSWLHARPEDMQLPLYFVAAEETENQNVTALTIAHVNVEKIGYSGLVAHDNVDSSLKPINDDEKILETWEQLANQWQTRVEFIASEFNNGLSRVDPVNGNKTCEYCGLDPLCRIQEITLSTRDGQSS